MINIVTSNGFFSDGTKPLPEPYDNIRPKWVKQTQNSNVILFSANRLAFIDNQKL